MKNINSEIIIYKPFMLNSPVILRCVMPVVCRKTNGDVNISHETTTVVVWIYDGI